MNSQSLSDDAERLLIKKLKIECGSHYTSKIEGMIIDMKLSKDSIKEFTFDPEDIEFRVLTSAFWPNSQVSCISLPTEFSIKLERFRKFYLNRFQGRVLFWKTNLGNAEMRAYLGARREKHELIVSTYQMAVLLLFNDKEKYKYEEICYMLQVTDPDFEYHMLGLLKSNILLKNTSEKEIANKTEIFLNGDYRKKLFRVIVPVLANKEQIEENIGQAVSESVEDDRKHMIEAVIVKIMKSRRVIMHQMLVNEVIKMVSWKFVANQKQIKGRIENLIEREFLQRDPKNPNMYTYIV